MSLSRAAIVDQLKEIVGADRVITDETVLKKNSIDRFRKFPGYSWYLYFADSGSGRKTRFHRTSLPCAEFYECAQN
ncbi:putative FAD-binding oxidoreductase [Escherichia coli]|uniref:Putative FAD-binding oxidoreductase n=1 Tax=Escherichia coli TaxID=562 RepID=A0A2X3K2H9_ECOLX|nr:putative FAD-binding oxidoreductase [Escherichia coli]